MPRLDYQPQLQNDPQSPELLEGIGREQAIQEAYSDVMNAEDPFYFLDLNKLRQTARFYKEQFLPEDERALVAYAVKANPLELIVQTLYQEGIDAFDCASLGEIDLIRKLAPAAKILFNHPIKKAKDIHRASEDYDVDHFTAQTQTEINKIIAAVSPYDTARNLEIAVRMATNNSAAGINLSSKYGATPESVVKMIRYIASEGLTPGISVHTGSQNSSPQTYSSAIDKIIDVAEKSPSLGSINVGGGIPVSYFEHENYDLSQYMQVINQSLRKLKRRLPDGLRNDHKLIIELGRALVANSIELIVPILAKETRNGQEVLYLSDGVFGSFSDYAVHGWQYNIEVLDAHGQQEAPAIPYKLYGPTCDSGDHLGIVTLSSNIDPKKHKLRIRNAGAYMHSQRSNFNSIEPPQIIAYT